jgi:transposase
MGTVRRTHSPAFKKQVVLALLKEDKTRAEIASQFGIHPALADKWKVVALANLEKLFAEKYDKERIRDKALIDELYRQLGQLKYELSWLKKKMGLIE